MEIYLIRHTTPAVEKGVCYGQTDLDITESFEQEASEIARHLPADIQRVYASPLKRCHQLAQTLFAGQPIQLDDRLKELHCGDWEMQWWDKIDPGPLQVWMDDFVNVSAPGGESYQILADRVTAFFKELPQTHSPIAIVTHGGVIRSLLSHIASVELQRSFEVFTIHYGAVVKIEETVGGYVHTFLHNPKTVDEQHRPSEKR